MKAKTSTQCQVFGDFKVEYFFSLHGEWCRNEFKSKELTLKFIKTSENFHFLPPSSTKSFRDLLRIIMSL
jgi:hypothetical protein